MIDKADLLDLPMATRRLGTDETAVLRWVRDGRLGTVGWEGSSPTFRRADIERLRQELVAESQPWLCWDAFPWGR
jgi:hypothetical protein